MLWIIIVRIIVMRKLKFIPFYLPVHHRRSPYYRPRWLLYHLVQKHGRKLKHLAKYIFLIYSDSWADWWHSIKLLLISLQIQNIAVSDGLTDSLRILAVITLLVYEAAYALGLGPVPLLNLTEVFPAAVRGKCISFVSIVIWITYIIATESVSAMTSKFPIFLFFYKFKKKYNIFHLIIIPLSESLTLAGSYLFYSFMCLVTIFYVFLFIPETKGKSLHQIAQELRKISLGTRICNNLRSLPLICHIQWIKRYNENTNNGQSTLIWKWNFNYQNIGLSQKFL